MPETRVVLVLFYRSVGDSEIEKVLNGFGPAFLQRGQVFQENRSLHAVEVLAASAVEWKGALAQLPEVVWTECIISPTFAPDRAV